RRFRTQRRRLRSGHRAFGLHSGFAAVRYRRRVLAGDGAGVYRAVERVIESGQDPRRFVEDLLERFRDLIVINAAPEAAHAFLPEVPPDRLERLTLQANGFGQGELSRAADLLNAGLTEMSGATSPRLQLELICARILLPGSGRSRDAVLSRVERMERRIGM